MKLSKLIPTIACTGTMLTIAPFLASCNPITPVPPPAPFDPIIEWKAGQTFTSTIPPKEFEGEEGEFDSPTNYLIAYGQEIKNNSLILAEDLVNSYVNSDMKQGMITKIKLGDLSIKLASSFFRFSCTLYTTYRYSEEFTMTNKFISFTDVPIECYVDTDSNYDVDKIYFGVDIEKLCDDNDWSVCMPDPYTRNVYKTYNMEVLKKAEEEDEWTFEWFVGTMIGFASFNSAYFQNATIKEE